MFLLCFLLLPLIVQCGRPVLTFGRPRGGFLAKDALDGLGYPLTDSKYMVYSNITQKVDHFNKNNSDTWLQRYQYNNKFYNSSNGNLVFLMLGGEGSISPPGDKWVRNENVTMMQWAAEYGAAAFQLEHRFYGPKANSPYGNQTTQALQYLTIDQALADIKEFITQMNNQYFKGKTTRWVTFGGSYPGSLSAFFRETYPEMTIGAVSSSSAVHVSVDYYGYAANTDANYRLAGCGDEIKTAFSNIIQLAYNGTAGRQQLKKIFNLCDDFEEDNLSKSLQYFFSNVFGTFQGINQYTGDNRDNATASGLGVPAACAIMKNKTIGDEITRVNAVWNFYNSWHGSPKCNDNSYHGFINDFNDTSYSDDDIVATRSWIWQTCTELGYFQTTDGGNGNIFGSIIPVDFYVDQCIQFFGKDYTLDNTYKMVAAVKAKYGAPEAYKGTNVVFPNGSSDPWKSLGLLPVYANANNGVVAFTMNGTAHCANMYPARASDLPSLTAGRKTIHDNLDKWIKASLKPTTNTASTSVYAAVASLILAVNFL